jgi:hypothetical protein
LLFPELGRAGDIAQPGGFRREHILRLAPNPAAEQPLLSTLLDPRLLRYFSKTELESDLDAFHSDPDGFYGLFSSLVKWDRMNGIGMI